MRKLLLGTTALAAAATLSANAALADVSISGYYEWRYESRSSQLLLMTEQHLVMIQKSLSNSLIKQILV
jgi:hypothetical protein